MPTATVTASTSREPAAPAALRLRRPGWRDPRLVVGVILVGGSVALGSWATAAARATSPVLVAARDLPAGHVLAADDVRAAEVALGALAPGYLGPAETVTGSVLARTVRAGELVPDGMLVEAGSTDLRTVALTVTGALPTDVVAGAAVDVWFVPGSEDAPPRTLATAVPVTDVSTSGTSFGGAARTVVEVLVPADLLADVLAATVADGAFTLVAAPVAG